MGTRTSRCCSRLRSRAFVDARRANALEAGVFDLGRYDNP